MTSLQSEIELPYSLRIAKSLVRDLVMLPADRESLFRSSEATSENIVHCIQGVAPTATDASCDRPHERTLRELKSARRRSGTWSCAPEQTRTKEKAVEISLNGLYLCRQRPTLPHTFACSTIGPAGLNFRVRDGNGWIPRGMITDKSKQLLAISPRPLA